MYQCILNVPLRNDWSKVTHSQGHGSSVLKALSFQSFQWISATRFAEFIQFWQDRKCRMPRTFWRENLVFHWRKIWYFNFTYIFLLVLLLFLGFTYIFTCFSRLYSDSYWLHNFLTLKTQKMPSSRIWLRTVIWRHGRETEITVRGSFLLDRTRQMKRSKSTVKTQSVQCGQIKIQTANKSYSLRLFC